MGDDSQWSVSVVCPDGLTLTFAESLGFWESSITKNQVIQKLLAFQDAFQKLFNIIESEVSKVACGTCPDTRGYPSRFNSANQVGYNLSHFRVSSSVLYNYFRESTFPAALPSSLRFPPDLPPQEPAPQRFTLQFWDEL